MSGEEVANAVAADAILRQKAKKNWRNKLIVFATAWSGCDGKSNLLDKYLRRIKIILEIACIEYIREMIYQMHASNFVGICTCIIRV